MKQFLEISIILRWVRIDGLHASREIDMILDTGALYTAISWDIDKIYSSKSFKASRKGRSFALA